MPTICESLIVGQQPASSSAPQRNPEHKWSRHIFDVFEAIFTLKKYTRDRFVVEVWSTAYALPVLTAKLKPAVAQTSPVA
jgi:hypothetical protein